MVQALERFRRFSGARVVSLYQHLRAEDAGGTVYALFILSLSLMLGGLAVDTVNAWRARSELAVIADLASHAGAVALAQNQPLEDIQTSIQDIVALNGATSLLRSLHVKGEQPGPESPISFFRYDPELNQLAQLTDDDAEPNAVALEVGYDAASNSALPTYFLGMLGMTSWNLQRKAVAALVPPSHCADGDAIVSRDTLLSEGKLTVGEGFCLHAQKEMGFSQTPELLAGTQISLPNLDDCSAGCADLLTQAPFRAAMRELNILQPEYHQHINDLNEAFADVASESPVRLEFFVRRPISKDLSPLAELGVDVHDLKTGDVIDLSPMQVRLARRLPQGLVYRVSCASALQETFLLLGSPGPRMTGSVLLTDCPVVVSRPGGLIRSLVISTWKGIAGADLPAIEVMAGSKTEACRASRTVLMSNQPIFLVPGASGDGLGLVSATDVALFPSTTDNPRTDHLGLSISAGRTAYVEGDHRFDGCGVADSEGLLPQMRIIRQVIPENLETIHSAGPTTPAGPRRLTPKAPPHDQSRGDLLASLP